MRAKTVAFWMSLIGLVNLYGVEHEWGIALTSGVSKAVDYSVGAAVALVSLTLYLTFDYLDEQREEQ